MLSCRCSIVVLLLFFSCGQFLKAEDPEYLRQHLRKKADLVAQAHIEAAELSAAEKAQRYRMVRVSAEKAWHTVFTVRPDSQQKCQKVVDATALLAGLSRGRLTPAGKAIYDPKLNTPNKPAKEQSWGTCSLDGRIKIGSNAINAGASQLFLVMLHEQGHAEEAERIWRRSKGNIQKAEAEWRSALDGPKAIREELIVESRAREIVEKIFTDGNKITEETLRDSSEYLADYSRELIDPLLAKRSWRSYKNCVDLNRVGAPGLVFGGISLSQQVDHHYCSHSQRYTPVSYSIVEDEEGETVIRVIAEREKRHDDSRGAEIKDCGCPNTKTLTYRPWSREDLWAAWHVIHPTESMKRAAGVEGGEAGLVSISGTGGSNYSLHPALELSEIGQLALELDQSLVSVLLDKVPAAKNLSFPYTIGDRHGSARLNVDKLDSQLSKLRSSDWINIYDCLEHGAGRLWFPGERREIGVCKMPHSQALALTSALLGLQWRDKSQYYKAGAYEVDKHDNISVDRLELVPLAVMRQALKPDARPKTSGSAQAILKVADEPSFDAIDTSAAMQNTFDIEIPNDDPGAVRACKSHSFFRMQEFARTLAILRGLKSTCPNGAPTEWDNSRHVHLQLNPPSLEKSPPLPEEVLSTVARLVDPDESTDLSWIQLGDNFIGVSQVDPGRKHFVYFNSQFDGIRLVRRQQSSSPKSPSAIEINAITWADLLRVSLAKPSDRSRPRAPVLTGAPDLDELVASSSNSLRLSDKDVTLKSDGQEILVHHRLATPIVPSDVLYACLWPFVSELTAGQSIAIASVSSESPFVVRNNFTVIAKGLKQARALNYERVTVKCEDAETRRFKIEYPNHRIDELVFDAEGVPQIIIESRPKAEPQFRPVQYVSEMDVARNATKTSFDNLLAEVPYDNNIERSHGVCEIELWHDRNCTDCPVGKQVDRIWTVVENMNGRVVLRSSKNWRGILTGHHLGKGTVSSMFQFLERRFEQVYDDESKTPSLFADTFLESSLRERSEFSASLFALDVWSEWIWDTNAPQPCKASEVQASRRGVCYHQALLLSSMLAENRIPAIMVEGLVASEGERFASGHAWVQYAAVNPRPHWIQIDQTNPSCRLVYIPNASRVAKVTSIRLLKGQVADSVSKLSEIVKVEQDSQHDSWQRWYERGYAVQMMMMAAPKDHDFAAVVMKFKGVAAELDVVPTYRCLIPCINKNASDMLSASMGPMYRDVATFHGKEASDAFSLGAIMASKHSCQRVRQEHDDRNEVMRELMGTPKGVRRLLELVEGRLSLLHENLDAVPASSRSLITERLKSTREIIDDALKLPLAEGADEARSTEAADALNKVLDIVQDTCRLCGCDLSGAVKR